jgi:hypothetical protein
VPAEATIRRTLARVDPTTLAAVIGAWLADRGHPGHPGQRWQRRAVAVDGKTLRGANRDHGRQVHLLAAMDHATRAVLAQRHVDGAPGEVPGFAPLLAGLDLAGAVVTADALTPLPTCWPQSGSTSSTTRRPACTTNAPGTASCGAVPCRCPTGCWSPSSATAGRPRSGP